MTGFITMLAALPLLVPAVWGLLNTDAGSDKTLFYMRNRAAGFGVILLFLLIALVAIGFITHELGGCLGGINSPISCSGIPDPLGYMASQVQVLGFIYLIFVGVPALACYVVAEIITRIRMKRA